MKRIPKKPGRKKYKLKIVNLNFSGKLKENHLRKKGEINQFF